ncbi:MULTISPECIES: NADH-quinone oxidoreductase subunit J [unclassified Luteococcus]|uniref:NADH-quinone oxidoreductase subunit J n=1 Tax=unclassified Luteococcus TaxID=2639923 RepID=UPI00313B5A2A
MTSLVPLVTAQAVAFWVLAPVAVLGALGMVLGRKPVHSAISLAAMMIALAGLYASLDAPFLFVVQIIVYTGAILMLFLFVLMLVGVDTTDSMVETIRGHRAASVLAALGFAVLLITAVGNGIVGDAVGLDEAVKAQGGNVPSLAELVFTKYVFVFEATAALLITAALAAMVLAHGEQLRPKVRQAGQVQARLRKYATEGAHPGALPNPGVYARSNAIQSPALLPDGSIAENSVIDAMAERGVVTNPEELSAPTKRAFDAIESVKAEEGRE